MAMNTVYNVAFGDTPSFKVGDKVTRDGSDIHVVEAVEGDWGLIVVRCIKAPVSGWINVGETESNLPRRYTLVTDNE